MYLLGRNGFPLAIHRTLGHNDDVESVAGISSFNQFFTKLFGPVYGRRPFWNKNKISFCDNGSHQGQVTAVPAHDLHDECPLMRRGCWDDTIDGIDDSVKSRISSDGHVRAAEIVVDRSDHSDYVEVGVFHGLESISSAFSMRNFCANFLLPKKYKT